MSASIESNTEGILTIKITGKLSQPELVGVRKAAAELIHKQDRTRLLIVAQKFQGWEKGGDWGDLSGQAALDPKVEKMAIVGEKKWEDFALIFAGQGVRRFPIQYFDDPDAARAWLQKSGDDSSTSGRRVGPQ